MSDIEYDSAGYPHKPSHAPSEPQPATPPAAPTTCAHEWGGMWAVNGVFGHECVKCGAGETVQHPPAAEGERPNWRGAVKVLLDKLDAKWVDIPEADADRLRAALAATPPSVVWDDEQADPCHERVSALATELGELRAALTAMVWQFADRGVKDGVAVLHTGGLSALESAFSALRWSDPRPTDTGETR